MWQKHSTNATNQDNNLACCLILVTSPTAKSPFRCLSCSLLFIKLSQIAPIIQFEIFLCQDSAQSVFSSFLASSVCISFLLSWCLMRLLSPVLIPVLLSILRLSSSIMLLYCQHILTASQAYYMYLSCNCNFDIHVYILMCLNMCRIFLLLSFVFIWAISLKDDPHIPSYVMMIMIHVLIFLEKQSCSESIWLQFYLLRCWLWCPECMCARVCKSTAVQGSITWMKWDWPNTCYHGYQHFKLLCGESESRWMTCP